VTQPVTLYSGFRLHVGGPYPTSRALEARPRGTVASPESGGKPLSTADAARYAEALHSASILEWVGRAASVGGLTSLLAAGSQANVFAANNSVAAEAYRDESEVARTR
jgi:hypothetical protein